MPKVVDQEARREELAAAVWRIAADRGLGAASLREVAAESGWSLGALRHYFATRDELLLFAFRVAADRGWARIARLQEAGTGEPRAMIRTLLREALPLDDERRTECRVWMAFVVAADGSPPLRRERERAYSTIVDGLAAELGGGAEGERLARLAWAAVDGLTLQALADPERMTPARQTALLDALLDGLL